MNKKFIRLTENDLHRIVKESVKRVLKENNTSSELQNIIHQLVNLTTSGYIPFSSPSPSSTEQIVKDNIIEAIYCLRKAAAADDELYGRYR